MMRIVSSGFGARNPRVVIAKEIGARQIAVRDLAGKPLRQRQPHRLRYVGHVNPEIATAHEKGLTAFDGGFGRLHDGVVIAFGQNFVASEFGGLSIRDAGDRDIDLKALRRKANAVSPFYYTARSQIACRIRSLCRDESCK